MEAPLVFNPSPARRQQLYATLVNSMLLLSPMPGDQTNLNTANTSNRTHLVFNLCPAYRRNLSYRVSSPRLPTTQKMPSYETEIPKDNNELIMSNSLHIACPTDNENTQKRAGETNRYSLSIQSWWKEVWKLRKQKPGKLSASNSIYIYIYIYIYGSEPHARRSSNAISSVASWENADTTYVEY